MNCLQAQRALHSPRPHQAAELRQHLNECTDCRVLAHRAARLQRLLALKRYEQPPPGYFDNFLDEFHRRLAEATQRPTWTERLADWWAEVSRPRLALAGAAAAALAVAGWMLTVRPRSQPAPAVVAIRQPVVTNLPVATAAPAQAPQLTVVVEASPFPPPPLRIDERPSLKITPVSFNNP